MEPPGVFNPLQRMPFNITLLILFGEPLSIHDIASLSGLISGRQPQPIYIVHMFPLRINPLLWSYKVLYIWNTQVRDTLLGHVWEYWTWHDNWVHIRADKTDFRGWHFQGWHFLLWIEIAVKLIAFLSYSSQLHGVNSSHDAYFKSPALIDWCPARWWLLVRF